MDFKYLRARRVLGQFLIKLAFLTFFGWLPAKIIIRITVSADDTGELVIKLFESVEYEPVH